MKNTPILGRLENVHTTPTGWTCRCPAHDDRKNSLSIRLTDDKLLLHCFAGCSNEAILEALGLTWSDLFDQVKDWTPPADRSPKPRPRAERAPDEKREIWEEVKGTRQEITCYDYTDEAGRLLHQTVRYACTERESYSGQTRHSPKNFTQRRPNGRGGWIYSLKDARRVLLHLPEVVAAVQRGETVVVVEGEKDAENGRALGLTFTCNAMGADKWESSYTETLRGARVIILPDNDDPGRKHRDLVAGHLHGVAAEVRVVELPGLPEKGDVSDWLAAGGTREELERLVAASPLWEPPAETCGERLRPWIGREIERLHEFAEVHPSGLRFPHKLTQRQYEEIGRRLLRARSSAVHWFNFAAGDWYNAQRTDYGYRKEWCDALFGKGMSAQIRSLAVVARAWPLEKRDPKVPWTFYRITAAERWCEHRAEWLRRYQTGEISIEQIQDIQKKIKESEETAKAAAFDAENFELQHEPVTRVEMAAHAQNDPQNVCAANVSYAVEEWEEFCTVSSETRNLLAAVVRIRGEEFVKNLLQNAVAQEIADAEEMEEDPTNATRFSIESLETLEESKTANESETFAAQTMFGGEFPIGDLPALAIVSAPESLPAPEPLPPDLSPEECVLQLLSSGPARVEDVYRSLLDTWEWERPDGAALVMRALRESGRVEKDGGYFRLASSGAVPPVAVGTGVSP